MGFGSRWNVLCATVVQSFINKCQDFQSHFFSGSWWKDANTAEMWCLLCLPVRSSAAAFLKSLAAVNWLYGWYHLYSEEQRSSLERKRKARTHFSWLTKGRIHVFGGQDKTGVEETLTFWVTIKEHNDFLTWLNTLVSQVQICEGYLHLTNIWFLLIISLAWVSFLNKPELNVVLPDSQHIAGPQIL